MSDNLWNPWRIDYILGKKEEYCIFCPEGGGLSDEERLILYHGPLVMVMMNKYPYNNGHLLVVPWRHLDDIEDLTDEEMLECVRWLKRCKRVLRRIMHPDGFNVGLNVGHAAGAGIAEHLHFHIVPRWNGDTNFMPVMADVRMIPEHLRQTYSKLLPLFQKEAENEAV